MSHPSPLTDRLGREYPRKNPDPTQWKAYQEAKKQFLAGLSSETPKTQSSSKTLQAYETRLQRAEKKSAFFAPYVDLTYDAEYEYKIAEKEKELLPGMIADLKQSLEDVAYAQQEKQNVTDAEEQAYQQSIEPRKKEIEEAFQKREAELKASFNEGLISKKALENGRKTNQTKKTQDLNALSYRAPKKYASDLIRNVNHQLKQTTKARENLLNEEISAVRRTVPVENGKANPLGAVLSFFFPGVGQIMNGQKKKGLLMLLTMLFIYVIAVPYALGFGNYQGDGVAGLITLGQNGARVDRSIIFLIEGIIAILFLVLSLVIMILSAQDAWKVSVDKKKGIRPNNWFETKRAIGENGFPYFVNIPAILLILFITLVPIFTAVLLSFTGMNPDHQSKFGWVGLENYMTIVAARGLEGSLFWRILLWTVIWTIAATTLAITVGMGLAILVNNKHIKGKRIFRTLYILPWAVPAFITIMFFSIMLSSNGFLTEMISGIAGRVVNVKDSTTLTRIALILIQVWCGNAYVFLLSTGVLQSIPGDLYEAADMDGASTWQRLRYITLPMVLFQTAPILVGQYTFNFNNYAIIDLFNGGGPFNPSVYGRLAGGSDLLISYIFKLTMDNQYQAFGAAISILISLVLIIIAFIGYRQTSAFKEA